jgi:hypothetical protein
MAGPSSRPARAAPGRVAFDKGGGTLLEVLDAQRRSTTRSRPAPAPRASAWSTPSGCSRRPAPTGGAEPTVPPAPAGVCKGGDGTAAAFGGRRTFRWSPEGLEYAKAHRADPAIAPAYAALIKRADAALAGPTYTVVDKTRTPPSGDKHDYISMGPYWWPDPSKPNGEPYLRRDGEFNPERATNAFDVSDLDAMSASVEALSLAYWFTDDARYATKAAQLLRVWFLDPATRMNPNTKYAQGRAGPQHRPGRGRARHLPPAAGDRGRGPAGPVQGAVPADQKGLERWFADYSTWMRTDPNGREEQAAANNHGIWFDYQLAGFSLFARQDAVARQVVAEAGARRIKDPGRSERFAAPGAEAHPRPALQLFRPGGPGRHGAVRALRGPGSVALPDRRRSRPARGVRLPGALCRQGGQLPLSGAEAEEASSEALPLFAAAAQAYGDRPGRQGGDPGRALPGQSQPLLVAPNPEAFRSRSKSVGAIGASTAL